MSNAVALLLTQTIRKFTQRSSTHANMMRLLRSLLPIITVNTGNQPPLHAKPQHVVGHATFTHCGNFLADHMRPVIVCVVSTHRTHSQNYTTRPVRSQLPMTASPPAPHSCSSRRAPWSWRGRRHLLSSRKSLARGRGPRRCCQWGGSIRRVSRWMQWGGIIILVRDRTGRRIKKSII